MTLPSASLPDRTAARPIPPIPTDEFLAGPRAYRNRRHPFHNPYFFGSPVGYSVGYVPYVTEAPDTRRPEAQNGYLHLQVQPANAQVYVDGYFMGSVEDFRRIIPGRSLEAGAHRVDVRAPGYEPHSFDVMIPARETVSYRAELEPTATAAAVRAVAARPGVPKTFYVIPGCYAGDKPPRGRLPSGCDRSKVRTVVPKTSLPR